MVLAQLAPIVRDLVVSSVPKAVTNASKVASGERKGSEQNQPAFDIGSEFAGFENPADLHQSHVVPARSCHLSNTHTISFQLLLSPNFAPGNVLMKGVYASSAHAPNTSGDSAVASAPMQWYSIRIATTGALQVVAAVGAGHEEEILAQTTKPMLPGVPYRVIVTLDKGHVRLYTAHGVGRSCQKCADPRRGRRGPTR